MNTAEDQSVVDELARVRNPRSVWLEFVLLFVTIGLYSCFWLFARARDIKNVEQSDLRPWLWFLVPLNALVTLFALPRLLSALSKSESSQSTLTQGHATEKWEKYGGFWVFGVFISSVLMSLLDSDWLPIAASLIALVVFCGLIALLQHRFNQWKIGLDSKKYAFHGNTFNYHWYEWLVIAFAFVMGCLIFYSEVIEPNLIKTVAKMSDKQLVHDESLNYSFVIDGQDWRQVPIGTVSDGTSEIEFVGSGDTSEIIIFDWLGGYSLNEATLERDELLGDAINGDKCNEIRSLINGGKGTKSTTICTKKGFAGVETIVSTFIQADDQKLLEFYAVLRPLHKRRIYWIK